MARWSTWYSLLAAAASAAAVIVWWWHRDQMWALALLGCGSALAARILISHLSPKTRLALSVYISGMRAYEARYRKSVFSSQRLFHDGGLLTVGPATIELAEVFVDVDLAVSSPEQAGAGVLNGSPAAERRSIWSFLDHEHPAVLAVLGAPGSGKTTLLRHVAFEMVRDARRHRRRLPVLVTLREITSETWRDKGLTLPQLLSRVIPNLRVDIPPAWWESQLKRGACTVLLDGLDEVPHEDRFAVTDWIESQISAYPDNDFVVTSRPVDPLSSRLSRALVVQVQPLTKEQSTRFIHDWYRAAELDAIDPSGEDEVTAQADRLIASLATIPALRDLSTNPLLLTMIANIHLYRGALPGSQADLYREMCQVILWRRSAAKKLRYVLPGASKERILSGLAFAMMDRRIRSMPASQLIETIHPDFRRLTAETHPREFLADVQSDGMLVEREPGEFSFVHLGFQEYLAAAYIKDRGLVDLLAKYVDDPWWRQTTLLYVANSEADTIVRACLRSGSTAALSLAFECAEGSSELALDLREALGLRSSRSRLDSPRLGSDPLVEHLIVNSPDLAAVTQMRPTGLAPEPPWRQRLLFMASQAANMVGRRQETARDLYLAALAPVDESGTADEDVRRTLFAYLRTLSVASKAAPPRTVSAQEAVAWVMREEHQVHGQAFFDLVTVFLTEGIVFHDLLVAAICGDAELAEGAAEYLGVEASVSDQQALRSAWRHAVEEYRRRRRRLVYGLSELRRVELSHQGLVSASDGLAAYRDGAVGPFASVGRDLEEVSTVLAHLRVFVDETSFGKREHALRSAERVVSALREDIRSAPTALAVEIVEPAAVRLEELTGQARRQLAEECLPEPSVSVAVTPSSRANGVVTVQIKVTNAKGKAPLESAELQINPEQSVFATNALRIALKDAVPGGSSRTELVRLSLAKAGTAVTSSRVMAGLHYRSQLTAGQTWRGFELPVTIARPEDFTFVANPYRAGASGRTVEDPAMFFGRDELIGRVRALLRDAATPGTGVAIFGQKRAGKSSVRLHLAQRLRAEDGLPVVDIGNIGDLSPESPQTSNHRLLAVLLWRILEGAHAELAATAPLLPEGLDRATFLDSPDPAGDCKRFFELRQQAVPDAAPLVVIIDEFQYLAQWIRQGLIASTFLQAFKALVERRLFHLVLIGQSDLEQLIQAEPNAFGVFSTERVSYLDEPHAQQLIEDPVRIAVPANAVGTGDTTDTAVSPVPTSRYRDHAVAQILQLTGGSAFFIQRFCYHLVGYLNRHLATFVTEADVDQVQAAFLELLDAKDFDSLESPGRRDLESFGADQYREVLLAVARASIQQPATLRAIEKAYRGESLHLLLDDLVMQDVVRQQEGTYRIVVGIYQEWLLKYFGAQADAGPS